LRGRSVVAVVPTGMTDDSSSGRPEPNPGSTRRQRRGRRRTKMV